jgi:hypothetical protein
VASVRVLALALGRGRIRAPWPSPRALDRFALTMPAKCWQFLLYFLFYGLPWRLFSLRMDVNMSVSLTVTCGCTEPVFHFLLQSFSTGGGSRGLSFPFCHSCLSIFTLW